MKKILRILSIIIITGVLICMVPLSACGAISTIGTTYTVTFDKGNITEDVAMPESQKVKEGEKATKPEDPSADGWTFNGWYTTSEATAAFDFDTAITANTTIYANWTEVETPGGDTVENGPAIGTAVTVSLKLPDGFTVSDDWSGDCKVGDAITVPASSQISNSTGKTLSGWYVKYDGLNATEVIEGTTEVWNNCTLYPCLSTGIETGVNSNSQRGFDYYSSASYTGTSSYSKKACWSVQKYFFENDFGVGMSVTNAEAISGDYYRLASAYTVNASTQYSFKYYLVNLSEETLNFTLSQVTTQVDTSTGTSVTLSMASGEEKTVVLTLTPGSNNNILPVVTINNTSNVNFSLAMMIEPVSASSDEQTTSSVELTTIASSDNHDPIYYWTEGNVPYDSYTTAGSSAYNYCFMTPYLAKNPTGGAVLVFAGGGYSYCSNSYINNGKDNRGRAGEGKAIVDWYNAAGISVFVVNYRTAAIVSHSGGIYHEVLSDVTRAIRYLRANASTYNVEPDKIATQGYSAGGHAASMLMDCYSSFTIDDTSYTSDAIDEVSAKADAGVFGYGVLSLTTNTHSGTLSNFCDNDSTLASTYSPELHVTSTTSPAFVWCENLDGSVNKTCTTGYASALQTAGVQCESHVFEDQYGSSTATSENLHGIGTAQDFANAKAWPSLATVFLKNLGW